MTQSSYPFDNLDTTESQYSQLFRLLQNTGIAGVPGDTSLKVSADSSGMNVKVAAGFAIVRGHAYKNDADVTLTISAGASNPRRDLIVLRLDPSANSIVAAVKAGTPATSPADPTLTQTDEGVYELLLARVDVAANAVTISAGNVTDQRRFTGTPFGLWQSAYRPTSPVGGQTGFNTSINKVEVHNGTTWKALAFDADAITASQLSSGEQLLLNVGKVNGARILVQETAPTSPQLNDVQLW